MNHNSRTTNLTIGITDCSKYSNYTTWIKAFNKNIEIVRLSENLKNEEEIKRCHGVLFSGGEDVHPRYYGKPEYLSYCHTHDINESRDVFELKLLEYTESAKIPVLGICRGLQLYNVFAGGTLIPDIPSWGKFNHGKLQDGKDRYHQVKVAEHSWLDDIIGVEQGEINSNHHQAAERIGNGLVVNALSDDGVVEGIERMDPLDKGFLCLVQWHPERMNNQESRFVYKIREAFINASKELI